MSYCIEKDIAAVGFCRGMQMLVVVSGAENADEFMDRETALLVFEALSAMLRQ